MSPIWGMLLLEEGFRLPVGEKHVGDTSIRSNTRYLWISVTRAYFARQRDNAYNAAIP